MPIQTTYTKARANLAALWDEVTQNREMVIIQRRGAEDVVMISADELAGLLETAHLLRSPRNAERLLWALGRAERHLLRSPRNAERLLWALGRAERGEGTPQSVEELRAEVGLDRE